jgi:outer membrane protein OmpU
MDVGLTTAPVFAADGVKLGIGGFFNTAYMAALDDDSEGEPGNERNTNGIFNNAEIYFSGSAVMEGVQAGWAEVAAGRAVAAA